MLYRGNSSGIDKYVLTIIALNDKQTRPCFILTIILKGGISLYVSVQLSYVFFITSKILSFNIQILFIFCIIQDHRYNCFVCGWVFYLFKTV